jgi:hypothetical protein
MVTEIFFRVSPPGEGWTMAGWKFTFCCSLFEKEIGLEQLIH